MNIIKWFKNRQERLLAVEQVRKADRQERLLAVEQVRKADRQERLLAEERTKNDKLTAELTACRTSQEARFIKLRVNRDDIICIIGDIDDPSGSIGEVIRKRFPLAGEVLLLPAGTDIAVLTKTK